MDKYPYPLKRIGLIGGGQLARMMIYRTKKLGFDFTILDPDREAPAAALADTHLVGGLYDHEMLESLVSRVDVTTYDIEHTDTGFLKVLEDRGHRIVPSPRLLEVVQDKLLQKRVYLNAGLPAAALIEKSPQELRDGDFPVVQKTRKGGYDGRGVKIVKGPRGLLDLLDGESFLESLVPFEKELAVMVVRDSNGQVQTYPVVEMVFDPELNICREIHAPAAVDQRIEVQAKALAVATVEALQGVGIFGVELFLLKDGSLLVNETAPRPHNSGHYTMEACGVCQFENHIRAVSGLPLAPCEPHSAAVMFNLLGEEAGRSTILGLERALAVPGFSLHLYGKTQCRPGRKMGHFTVTARDLPSALERAGEVQLYLRVTGE